MLRLDICYEKHRGISKDVVQSDRRDVNTGHHRIIECNSLMTILRDFSHIFRYHLEMHV